jgi:hypothetical protein
LIGVDGGFLAQDDGLGNCAGGREETPVDIRTVTDIRVIAFRGGCFEEAGDEVLRSRTLFEEEFDGCCEEL